MHRSSAPLQFVETDAILKPCSKLQCSSRLINRKVGFSQVNNFYNASSYLGAKIQSAQICGKIFIPFWIFKNLGPPKKLAISLIITSVFSEIETILWFIFTYPWTTWIIWTGRLEGFFVDLKPVEISKNHSNITWLSLKVVLILKIWRMWLKN